MGNLGVWAAAAAVWFVIAPLSANAQDQSTPVTAAATPVSPPLSAPPVTVDAALPPGIDPNAPLYLIVDHSGSMEKAYSGSTTRLAYAVRRAQAIVSAHPGEVALSDFGGGQCAAQVTEASAFGAKDINLKLSAFRPAGNTPLAASLDRAFTAMQGRDGGAILLVTDGTDTCDRSICAMAREWRERGATTKVVVQGVGMTGEEEDALGCLSNGPPSPASSQVVLRHEPINSNRGSVMAAEIAAWVNILSWQLLALFFGVCLLPAIYQTLKRLKRFNAKDGSVELSDDQKTRIDNDAKGTAGAVAEEFIRGESLPKQIPEEVGGRLAGVVASWEAIQETIRKVAVQEGLGRDGLNSAIPNLSELVKRFPNKLDQADIDWTVELRDEMKHYRDNPHELDARSFKGYRISAGRLVKKIASARDQ